jgi:TetR/AcrR family transcriptional regulator, cholesterol catabolism regulator
MPTKKVAQRTFKPASQGTATHIPTLIKNPDRVAYRRAELIEVATKMFLERGFHNTSIRDIVRACSFNVASLYMYVSSKDDILYLVAKDLMTNIAERLAATKLDPTSPHRSLQIGFTSYCQIANRFRRPIRLLYREVDFMPPHARADTIATVSSVIDYFQDIIAKGVEAGDFRPVPPRLTALNIVTIAHMIALHTREVRALGDLDFFVKHQLDIIFAGLQASAGGKSSPATESNYAAPANSA